MDTSICDPFISNFTSICSGHGECLESGLAYFCSCSLNYQGIFCEIRSFSVIFKNPTIWITISIIGAVLAMIVFLITLIDQFILKGYIGPLKKERKGKEGDLEQDGNSEEENNSITRPKKGENGRKKKKKKSVGGVELPYTEEQFSRLSNGIRDSDDYQGFVPTEVMDEFIDVPEDVKKRNRNKKPPKEWEDKYGLTSTAEEEDDDDDESGKEFFDRDQLYKPDPDEFREGDPDFDFLHTSSSSSSAGESSSEESDSFSTDSGGQHWFCWSEDCNDLYEFETQEELVRHCLENHDDELFMLTEEQQQIADEIRE